MNAAFFDNPILIKHVRSRLRRQQIIPPIIIVCVVALLVMYAGYATGELDSGIPFGFLYFAQGVILLLMGTGQVSSTVSAARESEILDFHRVSPLPAWVIAWGFLIGAPIREYVLVLCLVPFAAVCAVLGPPGLPNYFILLALLWSSALLFHALGMMTSLSQVRMRRGNGGTVLVVMAHVFGGRIIGGIALPATLTVIPAFVELMAGGNLQGPLQVVPKFFGQDLPLWAQSFAYQLPLMAFLFLACVRRTHSAESPLYSKPQAAAFLLLAAGLTLAGLIDPPVQQVAALALPGAIYTMTFVGLALVGCVTPESGRVAIGLRRAERLGRRSVSLWDDAAQNGLIALLLGFIVLASGEAAVALLPQAGMGLVENPHLQAVIAALTVTYFGWGLQFFHLRYDRRGRAYFGVFLFLLWGVPLLLAAILAMQFPLAPWTANVAAISPLAGIATGTLIGLVAAAVPTLILGVLLRESTYRFERRILEAEAEVAEDALPII